MSVDETMNDIQYPREGGADLVEVVRCKDCRFYQDNNGGYPHEECKWRADETPDPNDFCSCWAERRDEDA